MRPLDFVKTENGNIGMITETHDKGTEASVTFIENVPEKVAWYSSDELTVIGSLPLLLAHGLHGSHTGALDDIKHFFGSRA